MYAYQHVPSSMVLLAGKRISETQVHVPMFLLYTLLSTVVIAICILLLVDKTKWDNGIMQLLLSGLCRTIGEHFQTTVILLCLYPQT